MTKPVMSEIADQTYVDATPEDVLDCIRGCAGLDNEDEAAAEFIRLYMVAQRADAADEALAEWMACDTAKELTKVIELQSQITTLKQQLADCTESHQNMGGEVDAVEAWCETIAPDSDGVTLVEWVKNAHTTALAEHTAQAVAAEREKSVSILGGFVTKRPEIPLDFIRGLADALNPAGAKALESEAISE